MKAFRLLSALFLLSIFALPAAAAGPFTVTIRATAGNAKIPAGTKVFFTIGGDGCPCTGGGNAVAARGGFATCEFTITCQGSEVHGTTIDTKKCRVFATASTGSNSEPSLYKGNGGLTQVPGSAPPAYQTSFTLALQPKP